MLRCVGLGIAFGSRLGFRFRLRFIFRARGRVRVRACRAEGEAAFGDGRVFVEAYVQNARHVEVRGFRVSVRIKASV